MLGVQQTLKTIGDLTNVAVDAINLAKAAAGGPLGWGQIFASAVKIVGDVKDIVADAPGALPELKDLDAAEVGQLGEAAYGCVSAVVGALAA